MSLGQSQFVRQRFRPARVPTHKDWYIKGESSLRFIITRLPEHVRIDVK